MKQKKSKIVGFDFDDTLVDENHSIRSKWEKVLSKFSYLHPDLRSVFFKVFEAKGRLHKTHVDDTLKELGLDGRIAQEMVADFLTTEGEEKLLDGVSELLTALKSKGFTLCILTGGTRDYQEKRIKKAGLHEFMDAVFYGDEYHKPDKVFFSKSAEAMGIEKPEDFIYVGNDLEFDIIPSAALGFKTYWLGAGRGDPDSVQKVSNMFELLNLMTDSAGILIVGGGVLQIPALKKAREMGLVTHLSDGDENCWAKDFADFFYKVDTKDLEATADLAIKLRKDGKIKGVYTQGNDVEYTVAYAANKAGLFGIPVEAAFKCNNKIEMRRALAAGGLDHANFASAKTFERFRGAVEKIGFPCYVKPSDNSASRGVRRLTDGDDLKNAFDEAMAACFHSKELLVEEEIPGKEYSVDTVFYRGKCYPAGISDRIFIHKKRFAVQSGSRTPSLLPEKVQKRMYEVMKTAAAAMGVRDGAFKGDLVLTPEGEVKIIEITARTSGGFDSQFRKPFSFGIDILKATIDIALGRPLDPRDLKPKWEKWSSTTSVFPDPGIITEIIGLEELKRIHGVREVVMLCKVGDEIMPYIDCAKRKNYIISSADSLKELKAVEEKIRRILIIKTSKK